VTHQSGLFKHVSDSQVQSSDSPMLSVLQTNAHNLGKTKRDL